MTYRCAGNTQSGVTLATAAVVNKPTAPVAVVNGNQMLVWLTIRSSTITMTPPAGWVQVGGYVDSTSGTIRSALFKKRAYNEAATWTWTLSTTVEWDAQVYVASGVDGIGVATGLGAGMAGALATTGVVTVEPGQEVVYFVAAKDNTTQTWTSSATDRDQGVGGASTYFLASAVADSSGPVAVGGTYSTTFTSSTGSPQGTNVMAVTLKATAPYRAANAHRSARAPGGPVFYASSYGATGDGTTDDTTAINNALQAAYLNGGGKVVLDPGGSYKITNTLWVKTNVTVEAYGAYVFLSSSSAIYMVNGYDSDSQITMAGYAAGWSNQTFLGGIYDAKGQSAATDINYNIMTFSNSRGVTIRDVTFRNVAAYHAVDLNCIDGATLDNCRFEGFVDNTTGSTRFFSEAIQFDQGSDGNSPCKNVTVTGCYMGPAQDGSGLGAFGKLVGTHTDTSGVYYTNIKVIGNTAIGSVDHSIQACSWRNSIISNNTIVSSLHDSIRVLTVVTSNTVQNLTITGNTITDHGGRGIYLAGNSSGVHSGITVSGNTISSITASSNPAIEALYVQNSTISGNTCSNSLSHGAQFTNCTDVTFIGNTVMNTAFSGVQTTTCTRMLISSNTFRLLGNRGVWLTSTTIKTAVINNHIVGASRSNAAHGGVEISNTGCTENSVINNRIEKYGSGTESTTPIVLGSSVGWSSGTAAGNNQNVVLFNSFNGWFASASVGSNINFNGNATTVLDFAVAAVTNVNQSSL